MGDFTVNHWTASAGQAPSRSHRPTVSYEKVVIKSLHRKLSKSERYLCKCAGLTPRKYLTGNLIHYVPTLDSDEKELLIALLNGNMSIHEGNLPFVKLDLAQQTVSMALARSRGSSLSNGSTIDTQSLQDAVAKLNEHVKSATRKIIEHDELLKRIQK